MGGIFTPSNELSQISKKNCAGWMPALFYMRLKISPRDPVKISAWYKYERFFYDFSQKDGWH